MNIITYSGKYIQSNYAEGHIQVSLLTRICQEHLLLTVFMILLHCTEKMVCTTIFV